MKWPETLTVVRHGQSAYNVLKGLKSQDDLYARFKQAYNRRRRDPELALELAQQLMDEGKFMLGAGDHDTPLTSIGEAQARATGEGLKRLIELPDVVFVSPYLRTKQTLAGMTEGWPALGGVKTVEEERLREQDHGLSLLYSDWRIFHILHPGQEQLKELQGRYWYRYPNGENVPDLRERHRSLLGTITRDYREKRVLLIGHHLSILALRANLERFGEPEFMELDQNNKPINCGVTVYRGNPNLGEDGKLELEIYNRQLYEDQ